MEIFVIVWLYGLFDGRLRLVNPIICNETLPNNKYKRGKYVLISFRERI